MIRAIDKISKIYQELKILNGVGELLSWDQQTFMPKSAVKTKSIHLTYILKKAHELISNKENEKLIILAEKEKLNLKESALLREFKRDFFKESKIPTNLVNSIAETATIGHQIWEEAKKMSKFSHFEKIFSKMIDLKKQYAQYIGFKSSPYDALLDDFEQEVTENQISEIFQNVEKVVLEILNKKRNSVNKLQSIPMSLESQKELNKQLLNLLGFPFRNGRCDVSMHPFTISLSREDVRITTFYDEKDFLKALTSTIHEFGHALYELQTKKDLFMTGLDSGISLGIHESQSRFWENYIGRSKEFIKLICKKLSVLKNYDFEKIFEAINFVKQTPIRIYADELTYNLHIILRFEIERGLFNEKIKPYQVREIWNEYVKKYLKINVKSDSDGVLQDVHWSSGYFGYFPTYLLGNLYMAQFAEVLEKEINVSKVIQEGEFKKIQNWLCKNIHQFGKIYTPSELIKRVSGKSLSYKPYEKYLRKKFD